MTDLKTLTVYLGSSGHARPVYKQAAETLGRLIGESGYDLVYGGMDAGLMGLLATHALKAGGRVTGIIPRRLKDSERVLGDLSETVMVEDLWQRKKLMFERADAVITLPGGFGTLDESLEVLYWGNLGLHSMPLVLVNIEGYWTALIDYLYTLPDFNEEFLLVVDTVEDVLPAISSWNKPRIEKDKGSFPHFEDEICRATEEPILIDIASVENTYYAVCALGLKQLGKHQRAIGFLNQGGEFDTLLRWFETAAQETFITQKCLSLYDSGREKKDLLRRLKEQQPVHIDLHREKWGKTQN